MATIVDDDEAAWNRAAEILFGSQPHSAVDAAVVVPTGSDVPFGHAVWDGDDDVEGDVPFGYAVWDGDDADSEGADAGGFSDVVR